MSDDKIARSEYVRQVVVDLICRQAWICLARGRGFAEITGRTKVETTIICIWGRVPAHQGAKEKLDDGMKGRTLKWNFKFQSKIFLVSFLLYWSHDHWSGLPQLQTLYSSHHIRYRFECDDNLSLVNTSLLACVPFCICATVKESVNFGGPREQ